LEEILAEQTLLVSQIAFFGNRAGNQNLTGSNNIAIGRGSGPTAAMSNQNNKLFFDVNSANSGNENPLIYWEFDNDLIRIKRHL